MPPTCPWVSPADLPASKGRARPKSATQAVRLFFSSTFLLLMSLKDKTRWKSDGDVSLGPVSGAEKQRSRQEGEREQQRGTPPTCGRWRACVHLCGLECPHEGRPGHGPPSGQCDTAHSTRPRWPSGSLSASPEGADTGSERGGSGEYGHNSLTEVAGTMKKMQHQKFKEKISIEKLMEENRISLKTSC